MITKIFELFTTTSNTLHGSTDVCCCIAQRLRRITVATRARVVRLLPMVPPLMRSLPSAGYASLVLSDLVLFGSVRRPSLCVLDRPRKLAVQVELVGLHFSRLHS